jgi:imidazolonepropionase-like amidohydrolase
MDSGKQEWAATAASPPPYAEAGAYPTDVPRHRRLRGPFPIPAWVCIGYFVLIAFSTWRLVAGLQSWTGLRNASTSPAIFEGNKLQASLAQCAAMRTFPDRLDAAKRTVNPRWNSVNGQKGRLVLRNATLFDGEMTLPKPMDIVLQEGLVKQVREFDPADLTIMTDGKANVINLYGAFVTPGLVDMHSHHLIDAWPAIPGGLQDGNEVGYGPLTPFVRVLDGMKAYDPATEMIASGGVTTSLVIPGSANIMGGEGTVVKNRLRSGPQGELVVEDLLLEHGIDVEKRHRYMKMACGENPMDVYGHTRMGNAWELRSHLQKAKELMDKQDEWCTAADAARHQDPVGQKIFLDTYGPSVPLDLKLESTVAMLRGRVAMHNHCYEPEDMETMLRISHEFGFRVRAFHHAIEAWQVPEMLKREGENVTIATFAEFALYKVEAYHPSLEAGRILDEAGIEVSYKSDHVQDSTNSKFLMSQAAIGHSFGMKGDAALRALTSVPARSIDVDDRVGYVREGYDADLVVWDAHPLSTGATPREVWIDGVEIVKAIKAKMPTGSGESAATTYMADKDELSPDKLAAQPLPREPEMRAKPSAAVRTQACSVAQRKSSFVVSGIRASFLDQESSPLAVTHQTNGNLTLVISEGTVACLDSASECEESITGLGDDVFHISLRNGHLSPGLTAVTSKLGMQEIDLEIGTGDGPQNPLADFTNPANIVYAKYGVNLDGKSFARARLGGVTRAISPPVHIGGLLQGVSTGIRTSGKRTLLDGGIFQDEVALHVWLGDEDRINPGSISAAVQKLRSALKSSKGNDTVFGSVADGKLPLLIHAQSEHDVQQVILLKRDFKDAKLVISGGNGAYLVSRERVLH